MNSILKELDKDEARVERNWWKIASLAVIAALFVGSTIGIIAHYAQAGPSGSITSSTVDLKIKGNKKSGIYHLPNCPNYSDIASYNIEWFKTHEEAQAAGYRMARNCR